MNYKMLSASLLAMAAIAGSAAAQDDATSWTGVYAGVNLGGAWGTSCANFNATSPAGGASYSGSSCPNNASFTGGVQIGYNYQINSWVVGLEGDVDGATTTSGHYSRTTAGNADIPAGTYTAYGDHTPGAIGTIRARIGYTFDKALVYFTGGGVFAGSNGNATVSYTPTNATSPTAIYSGGGSGTRTGWVLGGGVEYKLTPKWSVKAEDLFMNTGNVSAPNHCVDTVTGGTVCSGDFSNVTFHTAGNAGNVNVFRLGVNYLF